MSWAEKVTAETQAIKICIKAVKVKQNPNFVMELDDNVASIDEVEFSDEDLQEGSTDWKFTLVGCVAMTEVSWAYMRKFIISRWKGITPLVIAKQNGEFLFTFSNHEEVTKIYESLTFVFDHPLLLKRYEPGMIIGKHLFDLSTVWIRLLGLILELWTPKLLSRVVSLIGRPLMTDPQPFRNLRWTMHEY